MPSGSSVSVIARQLPAAVERLALLLVEAGHPPDQAVAIGANVTGARLSHEQRKAISRWRQLRATLHEREQLANALLARRVLAEGVMLSLGGTDVRDGAVLAAHALCEARQARKPVGLRIGGSRASREQVLSARARLGQELVDLDSLVEAVLGTDKDLSRDDKSADANPRVVHLQNRLNSLGYRVQPDGIFGTITEESVKDLQAKAGLDTNGTVDSATRDALRNGGRPSWAVAAEPGVAPVPGATPPPLTPASADTPDVNKEVGNQARQAAPQGQQPAERSSDGVKKGGKGINVSVKLSEAHEALIERLQARLEEARERRAAAVAAGDGKAVRVAEARMRVFARHLEESIGPIDKGAFHRWLGKPQDEPITDADIARGVAAGGHPAKMARFAKAARGFSHQKADVQEASAQAKGDIGRVRASVARSTSLYGTLGSGGHLGASPVLVDQATRTYHSPSDVELFAPVDSFKSGKLSEPMNLTTDEHLTSGGDKSILHVHVPANHPMLDVEHEIGATMGTEHQRVLPSGTRVNVDGTVRKGGRLHIYAHASRWGKWDAEHRGMREADAKGDFPSTPASACPTCGAKVKNGVCQRGHSVRRLMEATYGQLVEDGLLRESWKTWDAERGQRGGLGHYYRSPVHPRSHGELRGMIGGLATGDHVTTNKGVMVQRGAYGEKYRVGNRGEAHDFDSAEDAADKAWVMHSGQEAPKVQRRKTQSVDSMIGDANALARRRAKAEGEAMRREAARVALGEGWPLSPVEESKQTAALSVTHAPIGKGGTNWVTRSKPGNTGQLPAYIQNIRNAIMRSGKPESEATGDAVSAVERWAAGAGGVSAEVKAAAAKAVAEWMALRGAAHARSGAKDAAKKAS